MEFVIHLVLVLHFLALAAILGGWIAQRTGGHALSAMVWGARAQLLIGLLLVGLNEMNDESLIHAKVAVKLLVAIAVAACAEIAAARARKGEPKPALVDAAAGLTVLNVLVAVLWH